jgi:hypothetical protein
MRKGLVVTLGVVALVFVVSPGFALAPVISCVPDIIVSDVEQNSQTADLNFFIFSDALHLDGLVRDNNDPPADIMWAFIETSPGDSIELNGIASNPAVNWANPGADDLRAVSPMLTVENVYTSAQIGAQMSSTIQLIASDGTGSDTADVIITTINDNTEPYDDAQGDGYDVPPGASYAFDTAEGWEFYPLPPYDAPTEGISGGALTITEDAALSPIVFGSWQAPKDPALAAQIAHKLGCVMRARYHLRSTGHTTAQDCPGFRLSAGWYKVELVGTQWVLAFFDRDINALQYVPVATFNGNHVDGREPGDTAQTYTLLFYPEQTDTLVSTGCAILTFDLFDNDTFVGADDAGTLHCDGIDVDHFDNPTVGNGRAEPQFSATDFSGWTQFVQPLDPVLVDTTGLVIDQTAPGMSITVASGNQFFEASVAGPSSPLDSGRYYRATFMVSSSQQPGGPLGPTVRGAIGSSLFVAGVTKDLKGGGLLSAFDATARPYYVWYCAPSPAPPSVDQTEPMQVIFDSYLTANPDAIFGVAVQGTVTCDEVITESWAPQDLGMDP